MHFNAFQEKIHLTLKENTEVNPTAEKINLFDNENYLVHHRGKKKTLWHSWISIDN